MFHIYDGKFKITSDPISFNWLQKMFTNAGINWSLVNTLPHGSMVMYKTFKIVRV